MRQDYLMRQDYIMRQDCLMRQDYLMRQGYLMRQLLGGEGRTESAHMRHLRLSCMQHLLPMALLSTDMAVLNHTCTLISTAEQ